jgi:MFS transporter, FSR family, fosmidomycin resistance protein
VRRQVDRKAIAALSTGHLATDFANGVLPALLPFLVSRFDLSYTRAGALVFASAAASSLVQPLFGHWSDRRGAAWLLPAGVLLSGGGMALAAVSGSYALCVLFVVVSGLGTAAYHPEGTKFASYVSGHRKASGMSLFSIGGNLGVALGAVSAAPAMLLLGRWGGLALALPAVVVAMLLFRSLRYLERFAPQRRTGRTGVGQDRPGAFALLLAVVTARTVGWFGLLTFVPLWAVELGRSESYGSNLLALMLFAGGAGTLAVGPLADRIGRRPVLLASVVSVPPLTLAYIALGGTVGIVALALVGVCVVGTFGLIQVMTQEYMPTRLGLASGISIGFAIGLGGVAAAALGAVADSIDLETALYVSAAVPALAIPFTLALPSPRGRRGRKLAPEPVM